MVADVRQRNQRIIHRVVKWTGKGSALQKKWASEDILNKTKCFLLWDYYKSNKFIQPVLNQFTHQALNLLGMFQASNELMSNRFKSSCIWFTVIYNKKPKIKLPGFKILRWFPPPVQVHLRLARMLWQNWQDFTMNHERFSNYSQSAWLQNIQAFLIFFSHHVDSCWVVRKYSIL